MAQLQCMDARLDTLSNELYQVNTYVGGFTSSLSLFSDEDGDDSAIDDDEDEDASSSSDKEMTTSQRLTLCHS